MAFSGTVAGRGQKIEDEDEFEDEDD